MEGKVDGLGSGASGDSIVGGSVMGGPAPRGTLSAERAPSESAKGGGKARPAKSPGKLAMFMTAVLSVVLMLVVATIVFFATVRGEEQVMVPDVVGKELADALIQMQEKELYPRVQLRYTDDPDDQGRILSQSPDAGTIVKAGRRIAIVVSRGVIIDHVENYVGEQFDDVKLKLQSMFTGASRPLIVLDEPSYKADKSAAGTIIAQDPAEGTVISSPVKVKLIVSRGPEYETTRVPNLVGLSLDKILTQMGASRVVFDFSSHPAREGEKALTATYQQEMKEQFVRNYTRVAVDVALPAEAADDKSAGIFRAKLSNYPYPVEMSLESEKDGKRTTLVKFTHTGGSVTVPYNVERDTTLLLNVAGRTVAREFVD